MKKPTPLLDAVNIEDIVSIAKEAGDAIMAIYEKDFSIAYKEDASPLTEADTVSHNIIVEKLRSLQAEYGALPVLSEEGKAIPYDQRKAWEYYWCIDPIDGTKEFIKKNGEFTVNIALIHNNTPVLGVVYAPALGEMYYAKKGSGAYKLIIGSGPETDSQPVKLPHTANPAPQISLTVVASKSHLSEETQEFIDVIAQSTEHVTRISKGSSLKLVMVAEGEADIYPRLAPTMEWDTAAADAIVRESGKMTYQYDPASGTQDRTPLVYNKEDLLNPWFVVKGAEA